MGHHNKHQLMRRSLRDVTAAASGSTASSNRLAATCCISSAACSRSGSPHTWPSAQGVGQGAGAEIGVAAVGRGDHIHAQLQGFRHAPPEAFRTVRGDLLSWTQGFGAWRGDLGH